MRARRREINIFNMSLLDILCGALGAFCFMMLVALPYYIPPGSGLELRKAQEETDRLLLAITQLKERLPDEKSIEEMERLLRELEAQIKALQGRVNILTAKNEELRGQVDQLTAEKDQLQAQAKQLVAEKEQLQEQVNQLTADKQQLQGANQQLTAKNEELTKANEKLIAMLAQRKPFIFLAQALEISQLIDVLISSEFAQENRNPGVSEFFKKWIGGDLPPHLVLTRTLLSSRAQTLEIITDVPRGTRYNVYLRLSNSPNVQSPTEISSTLIEPGPFPPTRLPRVTLTPERPWVFFGTITIDEQSKPIFKEAMPEERDAEWSALTSSTPPPAPTPTPPPSAEAQASAVAARERMQESSKKFHRLMMLTQQPERNEAEILTLSEELLKELPPGVGRRRQVETMRERALADKTRREHQQQKPTPSPTAAPVFSPTP